MERWKAATARNQKRSVKLECARDCGFNRSDSEGRSRSNGHQRRTYGIDIVTQSAAQRQGSHGEKRPSRFGGNVAEQINSRSQANDFRSPNYIRVGIRSAPRDGAYRYRSEPASAAQERSIKRQFSRPIGTSDRGMEILKAMLRLRLRPSLGALQNVYSVDGPYRNVGLEQCRKFGIGMRPAAPVTVLIVN